MTKKQFIIQYNPNYSLSHMFDNFDRTLTGKKHLQPDNVIIFHDLATIYSTITKARLDILTFLVAKQPNNISQLARLLKRHYSHVWTDCQALASLGIIELKKQTGTNPKEAVQPIALYEEITVNFPVKKVVDYYNQQPAEKQNISGGIKI